MPIMTQSEIESFFEITGIQKDSHRGKSLRSLFNRPYGVYHTIYSIASEWGLEETQILQPLKKMQANGENDIGAWKKVTERVVLKGTMEVMLKR
jgi:hypothetical protein